MNAKGLIKKTKQLRIPRRAIAFDNISDVLMVWDASQSKSDIEELKTFGHELRRAGKNLTFLTFHSLKKLSPDMKENDMHKLCCKGDFTMFAAPKSKHLQELLNKSYDLMINGCLAENSYLACISVFSKAKFRVGPFLENDDTNFYELLIKPNGADPCENYLIEIGRYLRKIQ